MAEKKQVKCYTRRRNNGTKYVNCEGGKKKAKAKAPAKNKSKRPKSSKAVMNRIQRRIVPAPPKNDMKDFLAQQRAFYGD
eukprot:SAG22_NODE_1272_length_4923_cov_3.681385_5_plen_80_part_00